MEWKRKQKRSWINFPFFSHYTGTLLHDHETAMYQYGTAHAECNVHILRYLKKNTEEAGNRWSEKLSSLLSEMNRERKAQKEEGKEQFSVQKGKTMKRGIQTAWKKEGKKTNLRSINTRSRKSRPC